VYSSLGLIHVSKFMHHCSLTEIQGSFSVLEGEELMD
jgi:hypothetical protein